MNPMEVKYEIQATVSQFEWLLLRELRKLQEYGYGDLTLKCVGGIFVDMRTAETKSRQELEKLQT